MDVVRFGRALGFGARQAVKTVTAAVDAATAENPSRKSARPAGANPVSARPARENPARDSSAPLRPMQARGAKQRLRSGGRGFRETAWRTFTRLGGVLWLEVSGVFFGIFALFALGGAWRLRAAWRATAANTTAHRQLLGALAMLAVFGYFCVSNFVRAHRRERRR